MVLKKLISENYNCFDKSVRNNPTTSIQHSLDGLIEFSKVCSPKTYSRPTAHFIGELNSDGQPISIQVKLFYPYRFSYPETGYGELTLKYWECTDEDDLAKIRDAITCAGFERKRAEVAV